MSKYSAKVALLSGAIDYAGTFPPAKLSIAESLKKASQFRLKSKFPWLMNRAIFQLEDIKKLTPSLLVDSGADGTPWLFSTLGTSLDGKSNDEVLRQVEWDLREIRHCEQRWYYSSIRQSIVAYEIRLSLDQASRNILDPLMDKLSSLKNQKLDTYIEISQGPEWKEKVEIVAAAICRWAEKHEERCPVPGLKVRTGGEKVPSAQELAEFIFHSVGNGIRFKATQGLHHAVTQEKGFGFVNLLSAINFLTGYGKEEFGVEKISACLSETDPKAFRFEGSVLRWKSFEMTAEQIETARRTHAACFGSCSLDEPEESLLEVYP